MTKQQFIESMDLDTFNPQVRELVKKGFIPEESLRRSYGERADFYIECFRQYYEQWKTKSTKV